MYTMKRLKSIVMAALAVVVAATYVLPAAQAAADSNSTSSSLSIVPKKNYVIEPGDSVKDKLTIRNLDSASPLTLTLRVIDFSYSDDTGTPKLFLDKNAEQTTWSLKPYLRVPEFVTVPPSSSKTLDMKVSIPKNRGAGTLYSAIVYSSGTGDEGGNVGLSASGVTLVFANIPGKVDESLTIEKFGTYDKLNNKYTGFIGAIEPERMGYTLKNEGNVTESPVGSITLKSMWGPEYKITDVNPAKSLALIDQTRTFAACIKSEDVKGDGGASAIQQAATTCKSAGLLPGLYTATIDLFYGQNGNPTQEVSKTIRFVYMPWWFVAVVLAVIGAAYYFGRKGYYKVRTALYGPQGKSRKQSSRRR